MGNTNVNFNMETLLSKDLSYYERHAKEYLVFIMRERQYIKNLIKHRYFNTPKDVRFFIMRRPDADFGIKKTYPYKLLMRGTKDFNRHINIGYQPVLNFVEAFNFFFCNEE